MKVKLILRKEISRKVIGKMETIKNSLIELALPNRLRDEIYDLLEREDDPETQYHSYGIATGFDSEIVFIDINRFVEQLEYEIKEKSDEDFDYENYKSLVRFLVEYEDYTVSWKEIDDVVLAKDEHGS